MARENVYRKLRVAAGLSLVFASMHTAAASADGGVLLSGYAPPGASQEAILGAGPSPSSGAAARQLAARAQSADGLAQQPGSGLSTTSAAAPAGTSGTTAGRHASRSRSQHPAVAAMGAASPRVLAAASGPEPGIDVAWWEVALAVAFIALAAVLARGWGRRDVSGGSG